MEPTQTTLPTIFDPFPEPVLGISGGKVIYKNPSAQELYGNTETSCPPELAQCIVDRGGLCVLPQGIYEGTVTSIPEGNLILLRPAMPALQPQRLVEMPVQLRQRLAELSAASEQLESHLRKDQLLPRYEFLLAMQSRTICRILRVIELMELTQADWTPLYPMASMDLAELCQSLAQEITGHAKWAEIIFMYQSDLTTLPMQGNRTLLEHMLLSLLSNAMKAAQHGGRVGLRLEKKRRQAQITIWDCGNGIPNHRLTSLFTQEERVGMPMAQEGVGLGLPFAQRVAAYHGGSLLAGSQQEEGTAVTVSLPLRSAESLSLHSDLFFQEPGKNGYSPVLVGLSDALPWQAFQNLDE